MVNILVTEVIHNARQVALLRSQGLIEIDDSTVIEVGVTLRDFSSSTPIRLGAGSRLSAGSTIFGGVSIGHRTTIGSGSIIGGDVTLGDVNLVLEQCVLTGPLAIGDDNRIGPFASIGQPAQDRSRTQIENSRGINIGCRNVIREFTTIHQPTTRETRIGNDCFLMAYVHIPHDAEIGNFVTITNSCQIAGFTRVHDHATLGLGVTVHQYSVLGAGVMIGMGLSVVKDVPPYGTLVRGGVRKLNRVGMVRRGLNDSQIGELENWYQANKGVISASTLEGYSNRWWYADMKSFEEQSTRKRYAPMT